MSARRDGNGGMHAGSTLPADNLGPEPDEIERELKLLTMDGSADPFYTGVTPFLFARKMLVHSAKPQQLIASQRDTADLDLLAQGKTLRLRANCKTGNLQEISRSDICIKIPYDKKGGLARREYEADQESFFAPDFYALREKYPDRAAHRELHETLDAIEGQELLEFFRVDVIRERHIVKVPNEAVGLREDQAFYGELLYDRIRYVIDQDDTDEVWILNPHCELELEPLRKVCPWNDVPNAEEYICKNISESEKIRCIEWFKNLMMDEAAPGQFFETSHGKAERGFHALMQFASDVLQQADAMPKGKLREVFKNVASGIAASATPVRVVIIKPEEMPEDETPVALHPLPPSQPPAPPPP